MENKTNILMERYKVGRLLGEGTFAKVYHGRDLATGQRVAIKVIDKENIANDILMQRVRHPHILQLYEVMATKTKIYFVLEYAKGGELFHKVAKGRLKEDIARKYFQQLITAVDFCHSRGVYHRDLKPENLLLDENKNLKLSDFGLSVYSQSNRQDGLLHTNSGTSEYLAPEVVGYDMAKADIWSCGVILFVLLAGYLPFDDPNPMEMYRKKSKAEYKCPSWFPAEVCRLLSRILDPNPYTRISIAKIMENPWFRKGLDCRHLSASVEDREMTPPNTNNLSSPNESCSLPSTETKLEVTKPTNFNAFDIISLSTGFDLSGLFVRNDQKEEVQFISKNAEASIISKLEEIARCLRLKVMKKEGGVMKLEGVNESRNGTLSIDVEIFEITSSFYLVEVRKSSGDAIDYLKMLNQHLKPALTEIVWAWQGEQEHLK